MPNAAPVSAPQHWAPDTTASTIIVNILWPIFQRNINCGCHFAFSDNGTILT
jgi:hypothetical protein